MTKKLFIFILLIFFTLFSLTVSSFASTDYSVLNSSNRYFIDFSFIELADIELPNMTVHYAYSDPDIYFVLRKTSSGYDFHTAICPFYYDPSTNSLKTTLARQNIGTVSYGFSSRDGKVCWFSQGSSERDLSLNDATLILSSDNIFNKDGSQLFFNKFEKLSPLVRTVSNIELNQSVTKEIISLLPIVLIVLISFIGIRKAISFTKNKLRNA